MSNERFRPRPDDDFTWNWTDTLTVTFTLAPNDVFAATFGALLHHPIIKVLAVLTGLVIILVLLLVGLQVLQQANTSEENPLLPTACVLVTAILVLAVLLPASLWLRGRAFVRQTRLLQGEQTIAVGEDGIAVVSDVSRTEYRWAAFVKVVETDWSFLFYVTGNRVLVLPARALPDPDQRLEVRQLIRGGMGDMAQLHRERL